MRGYHVGYREDMINEAGLFLENMAMPVDVMIVGASVPIVEDLMFKVHKRVVWRAKLRHGKVVKRSHRMIRFGNGSTITAISVSMIKSGGGRGYAADAVFVVDYGMDFNTADKVAQTLVPSLRRKH